MIGKKIFLLSFWLFVCFAFFPKPLYAEGNFSVRASVEYKVTENQPVSVTYTISIENLKSDYYPKEYRLYLYSQSPKNVKAYERGVLLRSSTKQIGEKTEITVNFVQETIGKGKNKVFLVNFEDDSLLRKVGEMWEVTIPKVDNGGVFNEYDAILNVSDSLGELSYVSPKPTLITKANLRNIYRFDNLNLSSSGITAGFGTFQFFKFNISYPKVGANSKGESFSISIPPDTLYQKMFYQKIDPVPSSMTVDDDGNWIATYESNGKEFDVNIAGFVQIFAGAGNVNVIEKTNSHDVSATDFWQSDHPKIKDIANKLNTPEEVYNFVVNTLEYNSEKASRGGYQRLGALGSLENPKEALCTEFTDLFVAILRAKGIPAREINGFAYTKNPSIEPLSLGGDVLHSWAEYYDEQKQIWVPVDPTWGFTTGGVDFFHKFDLRHFTFVIHSKDPKLPPPPGMNSNYQTAKLVDVRLADPSEIAENGALDIRLTEKYLLPFFISSVNVVVKNTSGVAKYNLPVDIVLPSGTIKTTEKVFLPFETKSYPLKIFHGFFSVNSPDFITVRVGDISKNIPVNRINNIYGQLVFFLAILFLIMSYAYYLHRRKNLYNV